MGQFPILTSYASVYFYNKYALFFVIKTLNEDIFKEDKNKIGPGTVSVHSMSARPSSHHALATVRLALTRRGLPRTSPGLYSAG